MTHDREECLQRALECARLSQRAADVKTRDTLTAMARAWVKECTRASERDDLQEKKIV